MFLQIVFFFFFSGLLSISFENPQPSTLNLPILKKNYSNKQYISLSYLPSAKNPGELWWIGEFGERFQNLLMEFEFL